VPPAEITTEWCARYVPVPELDDVLAGAVGLHDRELGYNRRFHYPAGGIGRLAAGLAAAAGPLELGREAVAVEASGRVLVLADERVAYDVLVSTAPLPELVARITDAPSEVREAARALRCSHLWYLDVALRRPVARPFHWIYVPEARYPFYRVGCYSNFSPDMAPAGTSNLYVELVDRAEPRLAEVLPAVASGLTDLGLIDGPEAIVFARCRRIDHAYVIFDHAAPKALEVVQRYLRSQRVLSVGRYGGWNYSAMADAIAYGREAASEAERWLGSSSAEGPRPPT
jgi:protoporphyrinogen oxidase